MYKKLLYIGCERAFHQIYLTLLQASNKFKGLSEISLYSNELVPLFKISKGGRRRRVPLIYYDGYPSALQSCLLN